MKITHGEELLLVKLQALACNFTKSNSAPWVFLNCFLNCINGTKSSNTSHLLNNVELAFTWYVLTRAPENNLKRRVLYAYLNN